MCIVSVGTDPSQCFELRVIECTCSDLGTVEALSILVIREVLAASQHLHALVALSIGDKVSGDGGVGRLALTASNVPGVAHHELEVVILVNGSTDICVVLLELLDSDLAVSLLGVPLSHELVQDVVLGHLTGLVLGVESDIVVDQKVVNFDNAVASLVQLLESQVNKALSEVVQVTTDTSQELVV